MTQPLGVSFDQSVRDAVMQILSDPIAFPEVFKSWVTGWIEANPPTLPISQITGFTQFNALQNLVATQESTTSGSYTDLATVGPTLTGIPDGKYLILFGSQLVTDATTTFGYMAVSENAAAASDTNSIKSATGTTVRCANSYAYTTSLANGGSNSLTAKYKSSNGTTSCSFDQRWLIALKYGNN